MLGERSRRHAERVARAGTARRSRTSASDAARPRAPSPRRGVDRNTASYDAVRDEHDGESARAPTAPSSSSSRRCAREFVERAERLVHQQQVGRGDERARDRRAHLHAAGELARKVIARTSSRPTSASAFVDRASASRARRAARSSGSRTLRVDARPRHQRRRLEHERRGCRPCRRSRAKSPPHQRSVPRVGATSPAIRLSSVDLAATGRPEQRHELAAADVEIDRRERARAVGVGLADAARSTMAGDRRSSASAALAIARSGQDLHVA